jgi:AcrR family transcriptional regulator
MKSSTKLTSSERREAILKAVRCLFAEKGFHGTTTRELADAAGVSEALLFKHFPTKEALFSAIKLSCCNQQDMGLFERLKALEPCASTLVLMVHFLTSRIVGCAAGRDEEQPSLHRLMLRSLAEDGEFARLSLRGLATNWIPKIEECLKVAVAAHEAVDGAVLPHLGGWFGHHLASMLGTHLLPPRDVVDYGVSRDKLVEQAVWFTLRGMGLKEETIKRYYNAKALALFSS